MPERLSGRLLLRRPTMASWALSRPGSISENSLLKKLSSASDPTGATRGELVADDVSVLTENQFIS